jgi:hypothetical protein
MGYPTSVSRGQGRKLLQYGVRIYKGRRKEYTVSRTLESLAIAVFLTTSVWAQQPQEAPTAPVPAQIGSAKKVFISNAGEESFFHQPKEVTYSGGPNRAYNEFYAAVKSWGRYEVVSAPGDADLVFEIGFTEKYEGSMFVAQFKLIFIDPKTHVALWTIYEYVEPAGMTKNRVKNYEVAMTALLEDFKSTVAPAAVAASK